MKFDRYYDPPEEPYYRELSNRQRVARLAHLLECGCVVKPGDLYCFIAYIGDDGKFATMKVHTAQHSCPRENW